MTALDKTEFVVDCSFGPYVHSPHEWREGFLWLRKRKCGGVSKNDVLSRSGILSPNEIRKTQKFPEPYLPPIPHKHLFRIKEYVELSEGPGTVWYQYLSRDEIAFQCDCREYFSVNRLELKERLMPQWANVEQTWPS